MPSYSEHVILKLAQGPRPLPLQERAEQQAAAAEQRRFAELAAWALRETLQASLPCQRMEPAAITGQHAGAPDQLPATETWPATEALHAGLGSGSGEGPGWGAAEQAAGVAAWLSGANGTGRAQPERAPAAWQRTGVMLLQLHTQVPALQHGPPQRALALAAALALRPALCALACALPQERSRGRAAAEAGEGPAAGGLADGPAEEQGLGRSNAGSGERLGSGHSECEPLAAVGAAASQASGEAREAAGAGAHTLDAPTLERGAAGACAGARSAWGFLAGNTLLRLLDLLPLLPESPTLHPRTLGGALAAVPAQGPAQGSAGQRLSPAEQAAVAAAVIALLGEAVAGQAPRLTAAALSCWAAGGFGKTLRRAADVEALHMRAAGVHLAGFN